MRVLRQRTAVSPFVRSSNTADPNAAGSAIFLDAIWSGNTFLRFVVSGRVLRAADLAEPAPLIHNQANLLVEISTAELER